jgi:hypothetical protein
VREVYEKEIIPFWTGNSQRERILGEMAPEWREAYEAGMFTEFQEQRAPGHTVLGDKIFRKGMLDIQCDIREAIAVLDFVHDPAAYDKREELKAMEICAGAVIHYAERHAEKLEELARGSRTRSAGGNSRRWRVCVAGCLPTRPRRSGKRFNITGLFTSASSRSSTRGIRSIRGGWTSTSGCSSSVKALREP